MSKRLIPATELAEFVYCAKAWELKYVRDAEPSAETSSSSSKATPGTPHRDGNSRAATVTDGQLSLPWRSTYRKVKISISLMGSGFVPKRDWRCGLRITSMHVNPFRK